MVRGSAEQRAVRAGLDPGRAQGWLDEWERWRGPVGSTGGPAGECEVRSLVLFLTGAECPFSCVFCDLWQHTLTGATPPGALVRQIDRALSEARRQRAGASWHTIKLYNASNWFEERAVPSVDDTELIARSIEFERVVVECHPRLVRCQRAEHWIEQLAQAGSQLEVALGLETTDPEAFQWLRKGCSLAAFEQSCLWLHERSAATRAFLLVGLPPLRERSFAAQVAAVVDSARTAADWGVDSVTLIPVREPSEQESQRSDRLRLLEDSFHATRAAVDPVHGGPCLVRVDTWDFERLGGECRCVDQRLEALEQISRSGRGASRETCDRCDAGWISAEAAPQALP